MKKDLGPTPSPIKPLNDIQNIRVEALRGLDMLNASAPIWKSWELSMQNILINIIASANQASINPHLCCEAHKGYPVPESR